MTETFSSITSDSNEVDPCDTELILAIVEPAPIDKEELIRCVDWVANAESDAAFANLVRTKKIRISWPEGSPEPLFGPLPKVGDAEDGQSTTDHERH